MRMAAAGVLPKQRPRVGVKLRMPVSSVRSHSVLDNAACDIDFHLWSPKLGYIASTIESPISIDVAPQGLRG